MQAQPPPVRNRELRTGTVRAVPKSLDIIYGEGGGGLAKYHEGLYKGISHTGREKYHEGLLGGSGTQEIKIT